MSKIRILKNTKASPRNGESFDYVAGEELEISNRLSPSLKEWFLHNKLAEIVENKSVKIEEKAIEVVENKAIDKAPENKSFGSFSKKKKTLKLK